MKRRRTQSDGQEAASGTASDALSEPPGEATTACLPTILSTLEKMQATIEKIQANMSAMKDAMQKQVADIKETQLSIISSQCQLSNQVLDLQNRKKKFYTRLHDVPLEIIVQIFAWIPLRNVLHYRRLSKTINQCLLTREFALLNVQTAASLDTESNDVVIDWTWFHLPEPYQTVYANAMPGRIKCVVNKAKTNETKGLPESITCLNVENIALDCCKLTGSIPDGI
ncbi:hypothetical protein HDU81_001845, partial [Chytriomyces hyalinus]